MDLLFNGTYPMRPASRPLAVDLTLEWLLVWGDSSIPSVDQDFDYIKGGRFSGFARNWQKDRNAMCEPGTMEVFKIPADQKGTSQKRLFSPSVPYSLTTF
jgi:hypothetical protein